MFFSNLNSQGGFLPEERSQRVQSKKRRKRKHHFCKTTEKISITGINSESSDWDIVSVRLLLTVSL